MIDLTTYEKTEGFKALNSMPGGGEFVRKFIDDKELTDGNKIKFLDYLKTYDPKKDGIMESYANNFFRNGNKFLGTSYSVKPDLPFIRIKDKEGFSEWTRKLVAMDISASLDQLFDSKAPQKIREIAFKTIKSARLRDDIVNEPSECERYTGEKVLLGDMSVLEAKTAEYTMWSFPLPDSEPDIFSDAKIKDLDCRAGLSQNIKAHKIVYTHDISSCKQIRKPTVYDAEFYPQFEPNGLTKPLDECKHLIGFPEYVHDPNKYKHIKEHYIVVKK